MIQLFETLPFFSNVIKQKSLQKLAISAVVPLINSLFDSIFKNQLTDQMIDRPTNMASYWVAYPILKGIHNVNRSQADMFVNIIFSDML